MTQPLHSGRHVAFVIRVHRDRQGLRGQVVAVETGAVRLFADLEDAMAFIREMVDSNTRGATAAEGEEDSGGGG